MPIKNTAFKSTKVFTKNFPPESAEPIEQRYISWECAKADAVAAERSATKAVANANIARAKANIAEVELLAQASGYDNRVASEKMVLIYKDKDGGIVFEVFSERVLRNAIRAQAAQMGQQAENFPEDGDIYEQDDSAQE